MYERLMPKRRACDLGALGAIFFLSFLSLGALSASCWALSAREILIHADRARGNLDEVVWRLAIESDEQSGRDRRNLEIKARGYDFLAVMTDPPKVQGHKLLMVNHNM